jgi:ribA/ribD-fused uncharacterized protein
MYLIYSKKWLLSQTNKDFLYFWGHFGSKDRKITATCLSQWFERPFTIDNIQYLTAEQWMMAEKARLFDDEEVLKEILKTQLPKRVKELGRLIKNFDEKIWNQHKENIVIEGNVAKFGQNDDLGDFLLNTKDKVLVEASPFDKIWGVGLSKEDRRINDPNQWLGKNLLGFALMEVRNVLKNERKW